MGIDVSLSGEEEGSLRLLLKEKLDVCIGGLRKCTSLESFRFAEFLCVEGKEVCVCIAKTNEVRPLDPAEAFGEIVGLHMPKVLVNSAGKAWVSWVDDNGCEQYVLAMECKPGKPWCEVVPQSQELLRSLGNVVGCLCLSHRDMCSNCRKCPQGAGDNACQLQVLSEWSIGRQLAVQTARFDCEKKVHSGIKDAELENGFCAMSLESRFGSVESDVPSQSRLCPRFDATDSLCVGTNEASRVGIVKHLFCVVSVGVVHSVGGLVAKALLGKSDLLTTSFSVVKGFNESFPLEEDELEGLYIAVGHGLLTRVYAFCEDKGPENTHAYQALSAWGKISSSLALFVFRHACRMEPCPTASRFQSWVDRHHSTFSPIFDFDLNTERSLVFDFSVLGMSGKYLHSMDDRATSISHVATDLATCQARYGIGRYLEPRLIYTSDAYRTLGNERVLSRTIHLGIDLFVPAQTPIKNPVAGVVHSFKDNDSPGDYGPTIIIEHKIANDFTFYTLFGHLSRESLEGKYVGCCIDTGQVLGWVGAPEVNGGWASHLHYQLMLDMCGCTGDFVGAAYPHMRDIYSSLCPNPNTLLRIAPSRLELGCLSGHEVSNLALEGTSTSSMCEKSVHLVRGFLQYHYDKVGHEYLDMCTRMHLFGHDHPRLNCAAKVSIIKREKNSQKEIDFIDECSKLVLSKFPQPLKECFFLNSYKDAIGIALYFAQNRNKKCESPALGDSETPHPILNVGEGCAAHSGSKQSNRGSWALGCEANDCHHAPEIMEIYCLMPQNPSGSLCIVDEAQTGFGRLGSHFWGFEKCDHVPDIVVLAVPISDDVLVGAVVTTHGIATAAKAFDDFRGITQDCRSASVLAECMKIVDDNGFQDCAQQNGMLLLEGIWKLQGKYVVVDNAQGCGLLLTFDMVEAENRKPSKRNASYVVNRLMNAGILTEKGGKHDNTVMVMPPLVISEQNVRLFLENLEGILKEDAFQ